MTPYILINGIWQNENDTSPERHGNKKSFEKKNKASKQTNKPKTLGEKNSWLKHLGLSVLKRLRPYLGIKV